MLVCSYRSWKKVLLISFKNYLKESMTFFRPLMLSFFLFLEPAVNILPYALAQYCLSNHVALLVVLCCQCLVNTIQEKDWIWAFLMWKVLLLPLPHCTQKTFFINSRTTKSFCFCPSLQDLIRQFWNYIF